MQQYRVILPDHIKAGDTIRIHCPDGTEVDVRVPAGLKGGDAFYFNRRGFLDREIVTLHDCCLAMSVGLVIGCAIVVGFLWGVLSVTDPTFQPASLMMNPATNILAAAAAVGAGATTTTPLSIADASAAAASLHQQIGALHAVAAAAAASNTAATATTIIQPPANCDQYPDPAKSLCFQQQQQLQQFWQEQMARQKMQLQPSHLPLVQQQPQLFEQEFGQSFSHQEIKVGL